MPFVPRELTPAQVLLIVAGLVILLALVLPIILYVRARLRRLVRRRVPSRASMEVPVRERVVTVGYANVRGWVAISEARSPEELLRLAGGVVEVVAEAVRARGGMVVQFQGDSVLFAFNAIGTPGAAPDVGGAVVCAAEIRDRIARDSPDLRVHIGLATGPALAGNIGGGGFESFQVRGDPAEHAVRLTQLAKADAPTCVLVDHAVAAELPAGFRTEPYGGLFSRQDALRGVHLLLTAGE